MYFKDKYISNFLKRFGFDLPQNEVDDFIKLFVEKDYNKGDHLVLAGEKNPIMAFVVEGLVRFYFNTFEGKEFNQTFLKENQIIVEYSSALTGEASMFSIQAMEATKVLICNYNDVEKFYDKHRYWERIGRLIIEENFIVKFKRETTLLLMDAKDRYLYFLEHFESLVPRLSQQDIALYLGVNPSTLNRLIKTL